jgi:hypothetical protein
MDDIDFSSAQGFHIQYGSFGIDLRYTAFDFAALLRLPTPNVHFEHF